MKKLSRGRNIDTIFVLIVFSIFAISVLMVLMLGASVYRNINDISHEGQSEHTALSYIWTKTKNFDDAGSLQVGDFHGVPALFIDEWIGDYHFRTAIYHYDGWLCELFSEAELEFSPEDGVRVIRVDGMHFESAGNGLIRAATGSKSLFISPRSGFGISPDKNSAKPAASPLE